MNVNVAKSLIVEFQSNAIDLTADELYDSDLLINYLAALLGTAFEIDKFLFPNRILPCVFPEYKLF